MIITARARLAGVIGWPVDHSLSPRLHGYWLDHYGIDGAYVPLAVAPEHFSAAIRALPLFGFRGCNVTLPHKEAALAGVDEADAAARRAGAVNTVVVVEGRLVGSNTDGRGFIDNLRQQVPDWQAAAGPAVVLGAGGSARAVVAALQDAGVPLVRLVNRDAARAAALATHLGGAIEVLGWPDLPAALKDAGLLVNTTSLGMAGQPSLDVALDGLPPAAVVADLVYVPLRTALLAAAAARGCRTVDGLGMLLHQARPGFAAWFGRQPEVTDALRRFVLA